MSGQEPEWGPAFVSPPVGLNDIRRWAIAIYLPERPPAKYVDPDRAGGVVAPPDFNPFSWMLEAAPAVPGAGRDDFPDHRRVMNGRQADS